ncbi:methyltransferase domain-containing protein [Amycolatopsis magusensis]|uniref:methyltransferase domain-containing protein n=1 Tax=Amycolatopsis magusensis TaxID=882444 RepID=UPI003C2E0A7F
MTAFDTGLLGGPCWLESGTGERVRLPAERWSEEPGAGDELLLGRCTGPTLDLGCGPGRLTAALTDRGITALGVDHSAVAVRLTRARGALALHRDLFRTLPGEGRWRHVLLADGNIGIGGDPVALLDRVRRLLGADGSVLVELDPPGRGLRRSDVRIGSGSWFPWAWVGAEAIDGIADRTGFRPEWTGISGHRWFAELRRS